MSTILHVDMDAFYASVELRRRPDLIDHPVLVGGSHRGVVLSASYPARATGITSGMPMTRARRLCPEAVVIAPDFAAYTEASKGVFAVLDQITAVVEVASIDEAYCDITGTRRRLGQPAAVGELVRREITTQLRLPCSVGIGPSRFVAKIASQQAKPNGLIEVPPDAVANFLHPLPVSAMWGVGEATAQRLHQLGLRTVSDLARTPVDTLKRAFGPRHGTKLGELAWGIDPQPVVSRTPERSIGCQETFHRDTCDPDVIRRELLRMSVAVAARVRAAAAMTHTISISLRRADFTELTRSRALPTPTDSTGDIYAAAVDLFAHCRLQRARIRRVGVRAEHLSPRSDTAWQPELLGDDVGWRHVDDAVDRAARRFGHAVVQPAALLVRRR